MSTYYNTYVYLRKIITSALIYPATALQQTRKCQIENKLTMRVVCGYNELRSDDNMCAA